MFGANDLDGQARKDATRGKDVACMHGCSVKRALLRPRVVLPSICTGTHFMCIGRAATGRSEHSGSIKQTVSFCFPGLREFMVEVALQRNRSHA